MYYNITLYTLNLHDVLYQLYLSKAGNNKLEGFLFFFFSEQCISRYIILLPSGIKEQH